MRGNSIQVRPVTKRKRKRETMNISESIQSATASFTHDLLDLLRDSVVQDMRVKLGIDLDPSVPDAPGTPSGSMADRVAEALQRTDGNRRLAAEYLGVSLTTVKRYAARLNDALNSPGLNIPKAKKATAKDIRETLKETGGNVAETMRRLGVSRTRVNKYR